MPFRIGVSKSDHEPISRCGCREVDVWGSYSAPRNADTISALPFSPEDSGVLYTDGTVYLCPAGGIGRLWVWACVLLNHACVSVLLCLLRERAFLLLASCYFSSSRRAVVRINKMLFVTWITSFLARSRWGLNLCFLPLFGLGNQSD